MVTLKQQGNTSIACSYSVRDRLVAIKIKTRASNVNDVLKDLLRRYNERCD